MKLNLFENHWNPHSFHLQIVNLLSLMNNFWIECEWTEWIEWVEWKEGIEWFECNDNGVWGDFNPQPACSSSSSSLCEIDIPDIFDMWPLFSKPDTFSHKVHM